MRLINIGVNMWKILKSYLSHNSFMRSYYELATFDDESEAKRFCDFMNSRKSKPEDVEYIYEKSNIPHNPSIEKFVSSGDAIGG